MPPSSMVAPSAAFATLDWDYFIEKAVMDKKPMSKWINDGGGNPSPSWRSKPIPLGMLLRGYLPGWLGGEMVYDAVVRTNHFESDSLLMFYLLEQARIAAARGEDFHESAIDDHIERLRKRRRDLSYFQS